MLVALLAVAPAKADPLPADADVVPASLTAATTDDAGDTQRPRIATGHPLPLGGTTSGSAGVPQATPRPLPDWRLLAALAAAFAAVGGYRVMAGRTKATLPTDVFEVLGEATLGASHSIRVVRFGPRTLLVSVSNAGCQTLAELTDPQATECIAAACRGSRPRPPAARVTASRSRAGASATVEVRG